MPHSEVMKAVQRSLKKVEPDVGADHRGARETRGDEK